MLAGLAEVAWAQSIGAAGAIALGVLVYDDPLNAGRLMALGADRGGVALARACAWGGLAWGW